MLSIKSYTANYRFRCLIIKNSFNEIQTFVLKTKTLICYKRGEVLVKAMDVNLSDIRQCIIFSAKSYVHRLITQETFLLLKIERDPSIESVRDTKISTKLRIAFFVLYCTNQGVYKMLG